MGFALRVLTVVTFSTESARCCNPATSSQCKAVCKAIFIENALPTPSQRAAVARHCDRQVASCVTTYTQSAPPNNPADSEYSHWGTSFVR